MSEQHCGPVGCGMDQSAQNRPSAGLTVHLPFKDFNALLTYKLLR